MNNRGSSKNDANFRFHDDMRYNLPVFPLYTLSRHVQRIYKRCLYDKAINVYGG